MNKYKLNDLILGNEPMVVGTISSPDTFLQKEGYVCDIIEVRLDVVDINNVDWLEKCKKIESENIPVIATLRLKSDGGQWQGSDEERKSILSKALENLSIIDIELNSVLVQEMCLLAESLNKSIIVSYHNFAGINDISELNDIILRIREFPNAIPKLVTMISSDKDFDTLFTLLNEHKDRPLCVMGMGPEGTKTRTIFPAIGASLTYGYIDTPSAPGQLSAKKLVEYLRDNVPEYKKSLIIRKKIIESV